MGVEASYRRVTPAEWEKVRGLAGAESGLSRPGLEEAYCDFSYSDEMMSGARYLSIEKEWHVLHALLTGDVSLPDHDRLAPALTPLSKVVMGGTVTAFNATYGKVRVLAPDEVREVSEALGKIGVDDLKARFEPAIFKSAEIYSYPDPSEWDEEELEPLLFYYPQLVDFFREAAREGDVILLSFD